MTRNAKKEIQTTPSQQIEAENYSDVSSALIQLGMMEWQKRREQKLLNANNGNDANQDSELVPLDMKQVQYLNMKSDGVPIREICQALNINPAVPVLWRETAGADSVYGICLELIDRIQADLAEDITRDEAQNNRKANLERMFYVKRWKPEYKDNFAGGGANLVQLNFTINGKPLVVDVTKEAGADDQ